MGRRDQYHVHGPQRRRNPDRAADRALAVVPHPDRAAHLRVPRGTMFSDVTGSMKSLVTIKLTSAPDGDAVGIEAVRRRLIGYS